MKRKQGAERTHQRPGTALRAPGAPLHPGTALHARCPSPQWPRAPFVRPCAPPTSWHRSESPATLHPQAPALPGLPHVLHGAAPMAQQADDGGQGGRGQAEQAVAHDLGVEPGGAVELHQQQQRQQRGREPRPQVHGVPWPRRHRLGSRPGSGRARPQPPASRRGLASPPRPSPLLRGGGAGRPGGASEPRGAATAPRPATRPGHSPRPARPGPGLPGPARCALEPSPAGTSDFWCPLPQSGSPRHTPGPTDKDTRPPGRGYLVVTRACPAGGPCGDSDEVSPLQASLVLCSWRLAPGQLGQAEFQLSLRAMCP